MLIDTSAWVEFVRATGSPTHVRLRASVLDQEPLATTDPVILELLATAASRRERSRLRAALDSCDHLAMVPRTDVEAAVELFEACRRAGDPPRSTTNCLIAAIAIRHEVPLLHHDRDFDVMAQHTSLQVVAA
ncbi:MAG: PIN domain nuclease [Candidatus Nanopelagicales bacterium]